MGMGNQIFSIIVSASSANFTAHTYSRVYSTINTTPIINGSLISMAAGTSLPMNVSSISPTTGVFLLGDKVNVATDTPIIGGSYSTMGAREQTILYEPFGLNGVTGSGAPYYNVPSGWTRSHITIVGFDATDPDSEIPPCDIVGSSGTILLAFSNANVRQEYLTTKAISTLGMTNVKLSFNEYRGTLVGGSPPLTLEYSPNNGSTWSAITWTETVLDLTWVATGNINLPNGAANVQQLKLRFGVLGDASGEYVLLDDVTIKATF